MKQIVDPPTANSNDKTQEQAVSNRRGGTLPSDVWKSKDDLAADQADPCANDPT